MTVSKFLKFVGEYYWVPLFVLLLFSTLYFIPHMEDRALAGKLTIGELTKIRRKSLMYSYNFGEQQFIRSTARAEIPSALTRYLKVNEKFLVSVDPQKPTNARILLKRPIIDSTFVKTLSEKIEQFSNDFIGFEYTVNGKIYGRKQVIEPIDSNLEDQTFDVMYKGDNPGIAYICIDSMSCYSYQSFDIQQ